MQAPQEEEEGFHYVKSAFRILTKYWYVFVISLGISLALAFAANMYLPALYEVSSTILIEERNAGNAPDPSKEFMKDFTIFNPVSDIQREMLKMKSSELIYKALQATNSELSYYETEGIVERELYTEAPFIVEEDKSHPQVLGVKFIVKILNENQFNLRVETEKGILPEYDYTANRVCGSAASFSLNNNYNFGQTIESKSYKFKLLKNDDTFESYNSSAVYHFNFNHISNLTYQYQKALKIEQVAKDLQAATIKIRVSNGLQGVDFINALTNAYFQRNIDKKNRIAENTIHYLDKQLGVIEDSLKLAETDLQNFRSTNKVMQINAKADEIFKGAHELENQKAELESRGKYYAYINERLEKNKDGAGLLVPSSMGVNDAILTGVIEDYLKLNAERNDLIKAKQTTSPYFNSLNIKIDNARQTLFENIRYLINTNKVLLANVEERLKSENAQITALPKTERQLVGKERKYRLNDNIYTFMLEKKAEAQVAKASNFNSDDILEPAKLTQPKPVSPNKMVNLIIALGVGLVLPFAGFGTASFLDNSIKGTGMVKSLTNYPCAGEVCHNKHKKMIQILHEAPQTAMAESLRTVRANVEFLLGNKKNQIILITSSKPGEGKSFNSLNLASGLALLNRKTIVLDMDLRRPSLHQLFGKNDQPGMSEVLNGSHSLEQCVQQIYPCLDFIAAGTLPGNPSELLNSDKTENLLNQLKQKYDYVILDTPPIGIVSETKTLMRYADLKLIIIRQRVTQKKALLSLIKEMEAKEIQQVAYILNDVDIRDTSYWKNKSYFPKA